MSGVQILEVPDTDDGARLDKWFKRHFPHIPHGRVEKLLRTGQIRIDGKRARGRQRLEAGQMVRIPPLPDPSQSGSTPRLSKGDSAFIRSLVIYEDDDLIALNKPAGLAVQGGTKTARHIDRLLPALGDGVRLVHRLDRDTSGVLVLARNAKAARWLGRLFQSHKAEKIYWGITNGVPRPLAGEIKGYMAKGKGVDGREIMQAVRHGTRGGKYARTLYQTPAAAGRRAAWVVMKPLTGRKHQLRLHMHLLGTPLAYDPKYPTDREPPGGLVPQLHLHARSLMFQKSDGQKLLLQAPLPAHMKQAFDLLGFEENTALEAFEV